MKIILLKDVPNIGKKHDVLEVSDGYAKNFLIKQNFAVVASDANLKKLEKELAEIKNNQIKKDYELMLLKKELESKEYFFNLTTNNDKSFGFIVNKNIIDLINKDKKIINKHMFSESYKLSLGTHLIKINLSKTIVANLKIIVNPK